MDDLKRVVQLAELLVQQQTTVKAMKKDLQEAEASLRRTETEDLPELMLELGLSSLSLADGSVVSVTDDLSCGISAERSFDAHRWLSENGFGGLIKTNVVVEFGRDEREEAEVLAAQIQDHNPLVSEKVHPSTLKAFLKEQLAKGTAVPFELFGIHPYSKATIKKGAKK